MLVLVVFYNRHSQATDLWKCVPWHVSSVLFLQSAKPHSEVQSCDYAYHQKRGHIICQYVYYIYIILYYIMLYYFTLPWYIATCTVLTAPIIDVLLFHTNSYIHFKGKVTSPCISWWSSSTSSLQCCCAIPANSIALRRTCQVQWSTQLSCHLFRPSWIASSSFKGLFS